MSAAADRPYSFWRFDQLSISNVDIVCIHCDSKRFDVASLMFFDTTICRLWMTGVQSYGIIALEVPITESREAGPTFTEGSLITPLMSFFVHQPQAPEPLPCGGRLQTEAGAVPVSSSSKRPRELMS